MANHESSRTTGLYEGSTTDARTECRSTRSSESGSVRVALFTLSQHPFSTSVQKLASRNRRKLELKCIQFALPKLRLRDSFTEEFVRKSKGKGEQRQKSSCYANDEAYRHHHWAHSHAPESSTDLKYAAHKLVDWPMLLGSNGRKTQCPATHCFWRRTSSKIGHKAFSL